MRYFSFALCLLASTGLIPTAQAQEFGRHNRVEVQGTAYHVFAEPGEPTIQVMLMGPMPAGIYEVSVGTDLSRLLALSGLAVVSPTFRYRVKLLRNGPDGQRQVLYDEWVEDLLRRPGSYPVLQEGDMVLVEANQRGGFGWRDALTVVTSLSALILLADRLRRLN